LDISDIGERNGPINGSKASFDARVVRAFAALVAVALSALLAGCGGSSSSSAPTTTADPQAVQHYVDAVRDAVNQTESRIAVAVDGPDNNYGIGTVSTAYHALVDTLHGITPPASMVTAHRSITTEANGIAREADAIGKLPTANNERDIRKEQLAERRQRFQANASALGS
jgi:hypothetical protein